MSNQSLYPSYFLEREGLSTLETESGFATYKFRDADCYIQDIYVKPERRQTGLAAQMADRIAGIAKENGYRFLTGSVDSRAAGSDISEKVLKAYGMRPYVTEGFMTYFVKEIA